MTQFTKKDAIAKLTANGFINYKGTIDDLYIYPKEEGYMVNIGKISLTEKNLNRVIHAAKVTGKIKMV